MHTTVENGMVVGLAAALEAHYPGENQAEWDYAEERVLCDVDTFAEWISGECFQRVADEAYMNRVPVESLDAATLLGKILIATDRKELEEARDQLRKLYLREKQEYVMRKYDEVRG